MAKQPLKSAKSSEKKEGIRKIRDISPYSKNFKCYVKSDQKDLIYKRQSATKLPRKDLEDKYIELCDENFFIKRQNNELEENVKKLTAKIIRLTNTQRSYSSSAILKEHTSENISDNALCEATRASSYSKPIIRSSSLSSVYRRNNQSAILSDRSKTNSSPSESPGSDGGLECTPNQEKGIFEVSEKEFNIEQQLKALRDEVKHMTEAIEIERVKNSKIYDEKSKLETRLSDIDLKKFLIENIEVNRLKKKLEQFRSAVRRMQAQHKEILIEKNLIIDTERRKCCDLLQQLNEERTTNSTSIDKTNELKTAQRTIQMLRKQISELEFDNKTLVEQQESLSKLLKDAAAFENESKPASPRDNYNLLETLEKMKTEKSAIENSKNEMFNKIRQLQDMNDKLMVDLEGLKTERNIHQDISGGFIQDCCVLLSEDAPDSTSNVSIVI